MSPRVRRAPEPRRSRLDVRLGRALTINQLWRCRADESLWRVRQVYRLDCIALLERLAGGDVQPVRFEDLRRGWVLIATDPDHQEAA